MTTTPTATGGGTAVEIYSPGADTSGRPEPAIWSGRVPNGDPEAIFRFFNRVDAADAERLRAIGYQLPSLSVGDIISYTGTNRILIVCPTGFGDIDEAAVQSIINAPDPHLAARLHAMTAISPLGQRPSPPAATARPARERSRAGGAHAGRVGKTTRAVTEPVYCACGTQLETPYERRNDKCFECERMDERMNCAVCEEYVGIAYCDGRPTFCSDSCEQAYWNA